MSFRYPLGSLFLLAALLTGCGPQPGIPLQRLAPESPAAAGLPQRPAADGPSPLQARPPFGHYAQAPSSDTLSMLSVAPVSPTGKYRATMTSQGAWVARIDGAWLWQIELPKPPPAPPAPAPDRPGAQPAPPPAPPRQPVPVGSLRWTPLGALLFQDDAGVWWLADPEIASVSQLPLGLQGKDLAQFSPDGKQVLYYTTGRTGRQLWVAAADGKDARLLGENVAGEWDAEGKLVVTKVTNPAPNGNQTPSGSVPGESTR